MRGGAVTAAGGRGGGKVVGKLLRAAGASGTAGLAGAVPAVSQPTTAPVPVLLPPLPGLGNVIQAVKMARRRRG